jgi:hypothetical protein
MNMKCTLFTKEPELVPPHSGETSHEAEPVRETPSERKDGEEIHTHEHTHEDGTKYSHEHTHHHHSGSQHHRE